MKRCFLSAILFFSLTSTAVEAQSEEECAIVSGILREFWRNAGGPTGFTRLKDVIRNSQGQPTSNPFATNALGLRNNLQEGLAGELGNAFFAQCWVRIRMREKCGCSIKGTPGPYQSPNTNSVASSPNAITLWFAGDSLTYGGGDWGVYLPGYNIANIAVSGSTSDEHFYKWNACAAQSESGHSDRTQQNPPPNANRLSGSINVQNRRVFLIFGGNDMLRFKTTLEIFPILTWFRYGNVINNYNRYITYVQAQSGANVTILGNFPFPTLSPFEHQNMQEVLQRLGLHKYYGSFYDHNRNLLDGAYRPALLTRNGALFSITAAARVANMSEFRSVFISKSGPSSALWKLHPGFFSSILFKSASGDNTWLSQRMLELATAIPVYTANRQVDYIPLYGAFVDPNALAHGYPLVGNPYLWIYSGGPVHSEIDLPGVGVFPNDSIHPGPLGYIAWSSAILPYLESRDLRRNMVPFSYNDGCNHEPGPGAPDAAQFSFKPGFVSGPLATAEPPPLPAVDDNSMMLLINVLLCFLTGFCH